MVETDSLSFILSCCSIPFYIIGLIGNVLVIRIVHKTREMHTPTNYLLASMAVSDVFTIMMFAALKFAFSQHVLDENFGHLVCKASAVITTFAIVSSTTLTVLAVERYNALPKPFRTGLRLSEDSIKKAIALIWVTSVFFKVPMWSQRKAEVRELRSNKNNRIWQCWKTFKWSRCRFFCLFLFLFVHYHSGTILAVWRKPEKQLSDHRKP